MQMLTANWEMLSAIDTITFEEIMTHEMIWTAFTTKKLVLFNWQITSAYNSSTLTEVLQ
jgi:hypothetical protein